MTDQEVPGAQGMTMNKNSVAEGVAAANVWTLAREDAESLTHRTGDGLDAHSALTSALSLGEGKHKREELPLLTVIVPVFNEAATVGELLRRVTMVPLDTQVIVVDDGSSDATAQILDQWESRGAVEVLRHDRNRGKGAAIRTALEHAQGRFTIIQDADLEYDPEEYPRILEPLLSGEVEVVYGSRYLDCRSRQRSRRSVLRWGVALLNVCVRLWYGRHLSDEATCYKAFPTALLRAMDLHCERFEFCPEVTAKAFRMGLRIAEVPIRYHARSKAEGKKIRWQDGVEALRCLWRWRRWQPPSGDQSRSSDLKCETG